MNELNKMCDICKENQATVYFKQTVNGKTTELHICRKCAEKNGIAKDGHQNLDLFSNFGDFDKLFGSLFFETPYIQETKIKKCPVCGYSINDVKSKSRLGCSECYKTFKNELNLKALYGEGGYNGKTPTENIVSEVEEKPLDELKELKKQLKKALIDENYELCAKLRDEIKNKSEGKGA